jgi:hygromycin-B 4-O-kinase
MRAVLPSLFRALDAISGIDIATSGGYGIWSPSQRGEHPTWQAALLDVARERPRIPGWRSVLEASPTGIDRFDEAYDVLSQLVASLPNERRLIHDDLLYRNVLVEGNRINAVIDWGNSMYGDHLYEAALLLYWWQWYPQWSDIDIRAELDGHWAERGAPPADLEQRLLAYQLHAGLEHQAYSAFKGYWDDLERNARQTTALAELAQESA